MIHRLSTWTLLILAAEAVEGRFLASVLAGMVVGRCNRPSRCGRATSKPWEPLSRGMNRLHLVTLLPWNDGSGGWSAGEVDPLIQVITTSSIRSNQRFLDQSRSSKLCTRGRTWLGLRMWHGAGAAAVAGRTRPGGADVPGSCGTLVPFPS
jgi:hypothetical protein